MHIVFAQPYGVFGSLVGKVVWGGGGGGGGRGEERRMVSWLPLSPVWMF
jgi:hypothetical protein